jgi:DNA-binding GntR family transcriptional regulator
MGDMKSIEREIAAAGLRPVRLGSLPETVAEQMRSAILDGHLKPGERLIEQKLADLFGIGQPTIREALKELEYQGFVRKLPNRATYVTELSSSDMQKMFEVRMALETLAVERAARNITPSGLAQLRQHLEAMSRAAEIFDLSAFHQGDVAFHRALWEISGNEHLSGALDRITFALFAFVLLKHHDVKDGYAAAVKQHQQVLDGLATNDPAKASRVFQEVTVGYWRKYRHLHIGAASSGRANGASEPALKKRSSQRSI